MHVDDSGVPSPAVGMLCVSPLGLGSLETSPSSSEMGGINIGSPTGGHVSPNEEYATKITRICLKFMYTILQNDRRI